MNAPTQLPLTFRYAPRHVACFSKGHSSACAAIEVARRYGTDGMVLLNHDINGRVEDPDVKRFGREVAAYLGLPITQADHARVDEWDQFDVVRDAGAFKVRNGQELCTSRLKTEPFMRWVREHATPGETVFHYGFDATEMHRVRRRASILGALGHRSDYPLALWPRTILSTREVGIEPPLTYSTFKHANCVGCLKAGRQHWFAVYATRPDVWAKAKETEDFIGYTIINGTSLDEIESLFAQMVAAGVQPTEHVTPGRFWSDARKAVRHLPVVDEEVRAVPCECATRLRSNRAPTPFCTCDGGHRHEPWCVAVWADRYPEAA